MQLKDQRTMVVFKESSKSLSDKAKFLRYQHGVAYYGVAVPYCETLFSFPVPLQDIEDGVLQAEDKIAKMQQDLTVRFQGFLIL